MEINRLRRKLTSDGRKNRMMKAIAIKMMPIMTKLELEEKRRITVDSLENENLRELSLICIPPLYLLLNDH